MAKLVSKVDRVLNVPQLNSLSNKKDLHFEFKANVPIHIGDNEGDVPQDIAESYAKSYPHVFSILDDNEKVKVEDPKEKEKEKADGPADGFDPVQYLEANPKAKADDLMELKQAELLLLCEALELAGTPRDSKKLLADKIAQEIKVKNAANEKEGD